MGAPWVDHDSWSVVGELSEALHRDIGYLLTRADADELRATHNAQIAAFTLSLVAWRASLGIGLQPSSVSAFAGHSLGEYTALVAAGALDAVSASHLVDARGEAMQAAAEAMPGTMVAVLGLDADEVAKACDSVDGAWPANDNAPGQVVVAGTLEGVTLAGEAAMARGAKRVMALSVGGAFHSPLMAGAQNRLDTALQACRFDETATPVVANVDAKPHRDGFATRLSRQLASPVRWRESLVEMAGMGISTFVELGPGAELSGMVKRTVDDAVRANVASPADLDRLAATLAEL